MSIRAGLNLNWRYDALRDLLSMCNDPAGPFSLMQEVGRLLRGGDEEAWPSAEDDEGERKPAACLRNGAPIRPRAYLLN